MVSDVAELPDARTTAMKILRAIRLRQWTSVLYLCDHLREGARCVGAHRIGTYAAEIERAARSKNTKSLLVNPSVLGEALDVLGQILTDCIDPSHQARAAQR